MTELEYLQDTYRFTGNAKVLEIGTNEFWIFMILDKTIFYPQWWGQPSDVGTISHENTLFQVTKTKLNEEWVVYHYGVFPGAQIPVWAIVELQVDGILRLRNAKNHSAGHLIDVAVKNIGLENLLPKKGFHFPEWSYVEYEWILWESEEIIIEKLNSELVRLVDVGTPVMVKYVWLSGITAPTGKTPRFVSFEWTDGCGCGGTHVRNSAEIGNIIVRKVKNKNGMIRVSYEVN